MDDFVAVLKNFSSKEVGSTVCALSAWAWANLAWMWEHWFTVGMAVVSTLLTFSILLLNFFYTYRKYQDVPASHAKALIELERAKVELERSRAKLEKECNGETV